MANLTRHSLRQVLGLKRNGSFLETRKGTADILALVVLNLDGTLSTLFETLWQNSSIRVCADGGANRLYDNVGDREKYVPDQIHGDLDSLRPEVGEFYRQRGTEIQRDTDQYMHDLDKCLSFIKEVQDSGNVGIHVVVLGAFGGQFHHVLAAVNMTFRYALVFSSLVLMDADSAGFLLTPGRHLIAGYKEIEDFKACGYFPIGCKSLEVTTKGFRWDLAKARVEFGGLCSSSNEMVADEVEIETSDNLFWTTSFRKDIVASKL